VNFTLQAEIATGARLAAEAGAAFVKTCTGFGGGGATVTPRHGRGAAL
jgi:deoxyribose-phosphate aldolase